jgi:peptidoglycan-associated lipoprotein
MRRVALIVLALAAVAGAGCHKNRPPVARPAPPPTTTPSTEARPPAPPEPVAEPTVVPPEPVHEDAISSASLDDLNRNSPLKPLFFELDSSEIDADGQAVLNANAALLKKYPTWTVTIEGHCDERGSAEYNLALGERRAVAARAYLVSLGISADRLRTVSYGKEFPFDPGHDEAAFAKNRRAHFVITAK